MADMGKDMANTGKDMANTVGNNGLAVIGAGRLV